jgi:hypothetical protein
MSSTGSHRLFTLVGLVAAAVAPLVAGCGGSEEDLAPVSGTVTLDGQPLAGAKVEFGLQTEGIALGKTTGTNAVAMTDANGRYSLQYTLKEKGAPIGKHVVRITTRSMTVDANGKEVLVPERLPPKYNVQSELTAEVKPGSNKIDFPLTLESAPGGPR